jgi:hypothetical protein
VADLIKFPGGGGDGYTPPIYDDDGNAYTMEDTGLVTRNRKGALTHVCPKFKPARFVIEGTLTRHCGPSWRSLVATNKKNWIKPH